MAAATGSPTKLTVFDDCMPRRLGLRVAAPILMLPILLAGLGDAAGAVIPVT